MSDDTKKQERLDKLDELTDLVLDDLIAAAKSKSLTAADRKLILDFLVKNGLDLDKSKVPPDIRNMLTSQPRFDEDNDVLPFRNTATG